jgi:hypothetical protein
MTKRLPEAVKLIRRAKRYLRKGWTKGYSARDKDNHWAPPTEKSAVCWCLVGALDKAVKGGDWYQHLGKEELYKVFGRQPLHKFNDAAESVDEVIGKLDHLEALYVSSK